MILGVDLFFFFSLFYLLFLFSFSSCFVCFMCAVHFFSFLFFYLYLQQKCYESTSLIYPITHKGKDVKESKTRKHIKDRTYMCGHSQSCTGEQKPDLTNTNEVNQTQLQNCAKLIRETVKKRKIVLKDNYSFITVSLLRISFIVPLGSAAGQRSNTQQPVHL